MTFVMDADLLRAIATGHEVLRHKGLSTEVRKAVRRGLLDHKREAQARGLKWMARI